jgi:hypothetical protein
MKHANSLTTTQKCNDYIFDPTSIKRQAVKATTAVENARQECLLLGHMLNEVQEQLQHGQFKLWIEKNLPEISYESAHNYARAAANIVKALPAPSIDIDTEVVSISTILSQPDAELSAASREWKQQWLDFTADKTIKECLQGVFVDGDEGHRADRAINGKTRGGTHGEDRKDFPLFCAVKMRDTSTHLSHWKGMSKLQQSELEQVFRSAILGDATTLSRGRQMVFKFAAMWPEDLCRVVAEACKERLKGSK